MFLKAMDADVNHMLGHSSEEIMNDVLQRFDPRPEMGIYVTSLISANQDFIPIIPSPVDLGILLKHVFRQAAVDSMNSWKRTPLHIACYLNVINSHEKIILRLMNFHGSNVYLKDMHGRRPIDLLMQDKNVLNQPSATEARESVILLKRSNMLDDIYDDFYHEERVKIEQNRREILQECIDRDEMLTQRLWETLRSGSILIRKYKYWEWYEDPDILNTFYTKAPKNRLAGDEFDNYTWTLPYEPKDVYAMIHRFNSLSHLVHINSTFLRKCKGNNWDMLVCNKTRINYYYNPHQERISFITPSELEWNIILETSKRVDRLGYGNEWELFNDENGNEFYRNTITKKCDWNKPLDAVTPTPLELLCTGYQFHNRMMEQKWFTCEQCNRGWKTSAEGANRLMKICEPCVARCHAGHKGIRFMRNGPAICICTAICQVIGSECQACQMSDIQRKIQNDAINQRFEFKRERRHNKLYPPVFCSIPRYHQNGSVKVQSGWMICRKVPLEDVGIDSISDSDDEKSSSEDEYDDKSYHKNKSISSHSSMMEKKKSIENNDNNSQIDDERNDNYSQSYDEEKSLISNDSKNTKRSYNSNKHNNNNNNNNNNNSQFDNNSYSHHENQSIITLGYDISQISKTNLPKGWVQVYDVEEPMDLQKGDKVLCLRYCGVPRFYGTIKSIVKKGFYEIQFDSKSYDLRNEVIARPYLELLSRKTFYTNLETGQTSWTLEAIIEHYDESTSLIKISDDNNNNNNNNNAIDGVQPTNSMMMTANDWFTLYKRSVIRRVFPNIKYEEYFCKYSKSIFYVNSEQLEIEKVVLKLQRTFRSKFRLPIPFQPWVSSSYTFDIPLPVFQECKTRAGWAYLRRRSDNVGEFLDINGDEWEEYMDKKTSIYFYWQEENNLYQWDKPELYKKQVINLVEILSEGEEVMFRFPGRRNEEIVIVTKVRYDDETGEDMYDLQHKYNQDLSVKWIARHFIKNVPKEGDALLIANLEKKWRSTIKKQREIEERRAKREKELFLAQELAKLEEMNSMASKMGIINNGDENAVSQQSRITRGRMQRIKIEHQEIVDEIDRSEGQARRALVLQTVKEMQVSSNYTMSRSDVLSASKSLDLKIQIENKVRKRNEAFLAMEAQRVFIRNRDKFVERELESKETAMTSPRSLRRRSVLRLAQMAMKRQSDGFMVCEWGCGDWIKQGHDQADHQLRRCTKRIMGCTLGCPLKHTEEYWLAPYNPPKPIAEEKPLIAGSYDNEEIKKSFLKSNSSNLQSPTNNQQNNTGRELVNLASNDNFIDDIPNADMLTLNTITNQQHHETQECVKRLVMCPLQCLEWVCFEVLNEHMTALCTKRPAEPLFCRLGCDCQFGGLVETAILAEDERLEHETEQCDYRIVRCNWTFEDGKACAAQLRAIDRKEHRDYHLLLQGVHTYTVAGTYLFKVPPKVTRLKVQLWGAGG
eukprot:gene10329-13878_t